MTIPTASEKIIVNFGWLGPSTWNGGWSNGGLDVDIAYLVTHIQRVALRA